LRIFVKSWLSLLDYLPARPREEAEARLRDIGGGDLCDTTPVEMTITLSLDFSAAGKAGSAQRETFNDNLTQDLSNASGLAPHLFEVVRVSAGSIIVDTLVHPDSADRDLNPMLVATKLQKQANQPNSPLLSGLLTRHCEGIALPTMPPKDAQEDRNDGMLSAEELFHRKLAQTSEGIAVLCEGEDMGLALARVPRRASQKSDVSDTRSILCHARCICVRYMCGSKHVHATLNTHFSMYEHSSLTATQANAGRLERLKKRAATT
jgi:hypothetical protein